MEYFAQLKSLPYLSYAFLSYLMLGTTDTVHHLHAALALGQSGAMYAAIIGLVLVPTAIVSVTLFSRRGQKLMFWGFISIAMLAIAVPGLYHGGWNHFFKVAAHLRIDSPSTDINLLFPAQNYNLWFYEITGVLEFAFALICAYFVYMLLKHRQINP